MTALVRRVLAAAPSSVVVGLTGVEDADAAVRHLCEAAGVPLPPDAGVEVAHADRIVSVPDPDEEVRTVLREVLALAEGGMALERIAVFFPTPDPYARTLLEQLAAAGVPHHGPAVSRLADSVAGRTLVAALALPSLGWGRGDVVALLSGAPLHHDGRPVPSGRWDELSRDAGVVGGLADWDVRLGAHADRLGAALEEPHDLASGDRMHSDLDALAALRSFVAELAASLDGLDACTSWAARAAAARALLERLLGPEHRRRGWPDHEVEAAARVDAALARLVVLDEVEPDPTPAAFRLAVAAELEARTGRVGRFGEGVLVAPLAASIGLDLDATFVVGMVEGACPSFRRDDSLLPDDDRVLAVAGELTTRKERLGDQHRAYLAALAAAGSRRTLLLPRGDLRDRRSRLASRWLLDSASHHAGRRLFSGEVGTLAPPVLDTVASYAHGVATAPAHGTVGERDVASLLDHLAAGGEAEGHPLGAGLLRRGLACHRGREGSAFSEWDGNVAGAAVPSPATGVPMSASRLETWAACPFRYFLAHVLRLGDRDDPEEVVELSALDRGNLVHEVLEQFMGEVIGRDGGAPDPAAPWTAADRARIRAIAEEVFDRYEAAGLTGRPLLWRRTRAGVLDDLDAFLTHDDRHRAAEGARPVSVEMAFGVEGQPPLTLALDDERALEFRGRADRVDRTADGRLLVLDYKTGRGDGYTKLEDDPVRAGRTLQLGLYAEAVRARHGVADVETRYWMTSSKGGFAQRGYRWTEERRTRLLDVVGTIVDGIESGTFPAQPGAFDSFFGTHENCGFCEFDRVCPRNRDDHQAAKAGAPELSLLALLQPADPEDDPR
jgi:RecB family exonuclease